jgi:hypothetical protein
LYNQIVNKLTRLVGILFIVFGLLAGAGGVARAQAASSQYFPETGHNVSGEFWQYYQNVSNATEVFGYPLTEAFSDQVSGRLIQYFTYARFELAPELPAGQRVQLSPLGSLVYTPGPGLNMFTPIGCRSFTNGFSACYAFLDYFDKQGGEAVFGQPISNFEFLDGRIVQYFERARFDWYPENAEGLKVVQAELGRMYFDLAKEDPNRLQPVKYDGIVNVLTLQTRVFAWKAVTRSNDLQFIYVVVQDQTLSPVPFANALVTITWPDGTSQGLSYPTNENGVVLVKLPVQNQPHGGLVTVRVQVLYQEMEKNTVTSFRIW